MAIEQLQFAPVITARTLEELARVLRDREREDVAEVVSDLIPVVQGVVEKFFKPISQAQNESAFRAAFQTFSREFEPYRLYINIKLLQGLGSAKFLEFYREAFLQLSEGLLRSANEKGIPAERLKKIIADYFSTLANLVKWLANLGRMEIPASVEELNLADWVHSSTNLDYGLTSLFLILEGTIPVPSRPIPGLLVGATEDSLNYFSDQCEVLVRMASREAATQERSSEPVSSLARTQELQWLRDHATTLRDLAGKWIVVEGDRLIAGDPSYQTARGIAAQQGIVRPFIIYVPELTEAAFMGL